MTEILGFVFSALKSYGRSWSPEWHWQTVPANIVGGEKHGRNVHEEAAEAA